MALACVFRRPRRRAVDAWQAQQLAAELARQELDTIVQVQGSVNHLGASVNPIRTHFWNKLGD